MAIVPQKIVLKSTTKITLNDRFSNLPKENHGVPNVRAKMVAENVASAKSQRLAQQMANRPTVQAALNTKQQSLQQRLGKGNVKARLNLPASTPVMRGQGRRPWRSRGSAGRGMGGGRGRGLSTRGGAGFGAGAVRGQGRGRGMRGSQGQRGRVISTRGRGSFRGRPGRGSVRGQGIRGRGGRGRGRGGRGGRGRGRGAGQPSREQLDLQIEEYMSKTKTHLDNELDSYMAQTDE